MATSYDGLPSVFDETHHAATLIRKVCRAFQLGPKYYFWDLPRYIAHRRRHHLSVWDMEAIIVNPFREFQWRHAPESQLVPKYGEALRRLADAGVQLTIPKQRLESLLQLWWNSKAVSGDVIECGAYRGATSLLLALLGKLNDVPQMVLILDTFEGMPSVSAYDLGRQSGEFQPSPDQLEVLRKQADALGVAGRIEIHKGLFKDTFAVLGPRSPAFAFVHIDANIYRGTLEACHFTIPRTNSGGIVVFDDYNGVCDLGARLAIDEYFAGRGVKPLPLAATSAWVRIARGCESKETAA